MSRPLNISRDTAIVGLTRKISIVLNESNYVGVVCDFFIRVAIIVYQFLHLTNRLVVFLQHYFLKFRLAAVLLLPYDLIDLIALLGELLGGITCILLPQ